MKLWAHPKMRMISPMVCHCDEHRADTETSDVTSTPNLRCGVCGVSANPSGQTTVPLPSSGEFRWQPNEGDTPGAA